MTITERHRAESRRLELSALIEQIEDCLDRAGIQGLRDLREIVEEDALPLLYEIEERLLAEEAA
jgi:hypothetical protein